MRCQAIARRRSRPGPTSTTPSPSSCRACCPRSRPSWRKARRRSRLAMQDLRANAARLAHMRHEVRTPVNAILGYSEMLLEDAEVQGLEPGLVADLQKIHTAGETLLALINDILDVGKIEARKDL